MTRRREVGSSVLALLLLLLVAAGAGAWNYRKNVAAEDEIFRPFEGYTDQALEDLTEAYETRQVEDKQRLEATRSRRVTAQSKAYFDEQVWEFERVQRVHVSKAKAMARMAESRTTLKLLEEEKRLRASGPHGIKLFLKRLLTI